MKTTERINRMNHISECYRDSDGYWASSKSGFCFPEMGPAHTCREDTAAEILRAVRVFAPCNCEDCQVGDRS